MLCRVHGKRIKFYSRNGLDWSSKFQNVATALQKLGIKTALFDGEIVIVDARGRSSFQQLQRSMNRKTRSGFTYAIFDLLYLNGYDLRNVPLITRKELLAQVLPHAGGELRFSEHFQGDGAKVFNQACRYSIEGIVSKLADSLYQSDRTKSWLKVKCSKRQEFVIVGYTRSSNGLPGFGSLILAVYEKRKLVYAGRVGTGFTFKQRKALKAHLDAIARADSPLTEGPRMRNVQWTKPSLVAEVAFTEWTGDKSIRHPSFQGLREDKKPKDVVREPA